jgi:hypothetical protein
MIKSATLEETAMRYLRTGYVAGWASDTWLTVPGSAYVRPTLAATHAEAETQRRERWPNLTDLDIRYVGEVPHAGVSVSGLAYRILPESPTSQPEG